MEILENVLLSDFTTMRVGGPARFFCRVKSVEELKEAVVFAQEKNIPFFILGGGSNIVFSDVGFSGLVIKIELLGVVFKEGENGETLATAAAGLEWDVFVKEMVLRGLRGLENLSLIPGSVGSAPVQNIGAYGVEVKDRIVSVSVLHVKTLEIKKLTNRECAFGYRESFFKTKEGSAHIIIGVTFGLSPRNTFNLSYGDLHKRFAEREIESISVQEVRDAVIEIRKGKLPYDAVVGSAGSFFKNPSITYEHHQELLKKYPGMPAFPTSRQEWVKIPAGWLIDTVCGMRGITEGNVGTYKHQALVVVNYGGATAREIKIFVEKIVAQVKEKTNITLEREVQYVAEQ